MVEHVYNHMYIVVDVLDPTVFKPEVKRGDILFWRWYGWYHTVQIINTNTREVKPVLNIVWLRKLSDDEKECLAKDKPLNECVDARELYELAMKRIERARKNPNAFPHLTEKDVKEILSHLKQVLRLEK